jgi:hypothetical protein
MREMTSSTIEIEFSCLTDDSGDKTYQVTSRYGNAGECPPTHILHHSHYPDAAMKVMRDSCRAAIAEKIDAITVAKKAGKP